MKVRLLYPIISAAALLLGACSDDETIDTRPRAYLTDQGLEGLQWETASDQGLTADGGAFPYTPGETVTLRLGDLILTRDMPVREYMTLLDTEPQLLAGLASSERINGLRTHELLEASATADARIINRIRLLSALDTVTGEEAPGTQFNELLRTFLTDNALAAQINFDQSLDAFADENGPVNQLLQDWCFHRFLNDEDPDNDGLAEAQCGTQPEDGGFVGRIPIPTGTSLLGTLPWAWYAYATRVFLFPEQLELQAGDTRVAEVDVRVVGLQETEIVAIEALAVEDVARLAGETVERDVVGIQAISLEERSISVFPIGEAGDETEIIVNLQLKDNYRWIRKNLRVRLR